MANTALDETTSPEQAAEHYHKALDEVYHLAYGYYLQARSPEEEHRMLTIVNRVADLLNGHSGA